MHSQKHEYSESYMTGTQNISTIADLRQSFVLWTFYYVEVTNFGILGTCELQSHDMEVHKYMSFVQIRAGEFGWKPPKDDIA